MPKNQNYLSKMLASIDRAKLGVSRDSWYLSDQADNKISTWKCKAISTNFVQAKALVMNVVFHGCIAEIASWYPILKQENTVLF